LEDGHPNSFAGGKRTLHTLMPGMLYRDGDLWGPIGTQGGDAQAQVHLQLVTDLVDFGMEPQEAIEAPRWVAGGGPGQPPTLVTVEEGIADETRKGLSGFGHDVEVTGRFDATMGHAQIILRDPSTGLLRGGADPRADGAALGL
jgi:gamma-glutamyltranspeptidase